jgi:hypothetical protein
MRTWLAKSLYEPLPYFYLAAGVLLLAAAAYLDYWQWRGLCLLLGIGSLAAGGIIWWLRRDYRRSR